MAEPLVDPIWDVMEEQGRSLVWLARVTNYSEAHVRSVKSGTYRPGPDFRAACARALQIPERLLFRPARATQEVAS